MKISELFEKINPDYLKGLTPAERKEMKQEIEHFKKMPSDSKAAYPKDWTADMKFKERRKKPLPISKHTDKYHQMYGESEHLDEGAVDVALKNKAEKTGIPLNILRSVFNRGMAAWRTGHRPGVMQVQWAMARVNSFITGGNARKVDNDLWEKRNK